MKIMIFLFLKIILTSTYQKYPKTQNKLISNKKIKNIMKRGFNHKNKQQNK
jgi:hypothetical protein